MFNKLFFKTLFPLVCFPAGFFFLSLYNDNPAAEKRLTGIRQLTFGGNNAEAYFCPQDYRLVFQSNNPGWKVNCDQIFVMDIARAAADTLYSPTMISTGK